MILSKDASSNLDGIFGRATKKCGSSF